MRHIKLIEAESLQQDVEKDNRPFVINMESSGIKEKTGSVKTKVCPFKNVHSSEISRLMVTYKIVLFYRLHKIFLFK